MGEMISKASFFKDARMEIENEHDQLKKYLQTINSWYNKHIFPVLASLPVLLSF